MQQLSFRSSFSDYLATPLSYARLCGTHFSALTLLERYSRKIVVLVFGGMQYPSKMKYSVNFTEFRTTPKLRSYFFLTSLFLNLFLNIFNNNIIIRNGKIVWKNGPYCWYFCSNLKYLGRQHKEHLKTAKMIDFVRNCYIKVTLRLFYLHYFVNTMVPTFLGQFRRSLQIKKIINDKCSSCVTVQYLNRKQRKKGWLLQRS